MCVRIYVCMWMSSMEFSSHRNFISPNSSAPDCCLRQCSKFLWLENSIELIRKYVCTYVCMSGRVLCSCVWMSGCILCTYIRMCSGCVLCMYLWVHYTCLELTIHLVCIYIRTCMYVCMYFHHLCGDFFSLLWELYIRSFNYLKLGVFTWVCLQ